MERISYSTVTVPGSLIFMQLNWRPVKPLQVTNVGGVFQPDLSRDGKTLLMRYAQAGGFALHTLPFDRET